LHGSSVMTLMTWHCGNPPYGHPG